MLIKVFRLVLFYTEYDEIEAVRKKRELEEQKRSKAKTRKLVAKVRLHTAAGC